MKEKMVRTNGFSFHGECTIVKMDLLVDAGVVDDTAIPSDATKEERDGQNRLFLAHSESGHHHYITSPGVDVYRTPDPLVKYVEVQQGAQALLQHAKPLADSQRHHTQILDSGRYRVTIQREATPEGWRKVQD